MRVTRLGFERGGLATARGNRFLAAGNPMDRQGVALCRIEKPVQARIRRCRDSRQVRNTSSVTLHLEQ
jgi:hypothetical protein